MHYCKYCGAAEEIRTPDPLVRSQILYPTELQPHFLGGEQGIRTLDTGFARMLP